MSGRQRANNRSYVLVCHDAGGTVPPMLALAGALIRAGATVTLLSQPSVEARRGRDRLFVRRVLRTRQLRPDESAGGPNRAIPARHGRLLRRQRPTPACTRPATIRRRHRREPHRCVGGRGNPRPAFCRATAQHVQDVRRRVVRRTVALPRRPHQRNAGALWRFRGEGVDRPLLPPHRGNVRRDDLLRCSGRRTPRQPEAFWVPRPGPAADQA